VKIFRQRWNLNHFEINEKEKMKIFGSFFAFAAAQEETCDTFRAKWVARKVAANLFRSENVAIVGVKLANYRFPSIEIRDQEYRGFVAFTEDVCGADFTEKLANGEVTVDLMDASGNEFD
jgi:hypothetical protein